MNTLSVDGLVRNPKESIEILNYVSIGPKCIKTLNDNSSERNLKKLIEILNYASIAISGTKTDEYP